MKEQTKEELQLFIRKNGTPDYVKVNGIIYTMEEYDMSGKEISYVNKRTTNRITVYTENRYGKLKFSDAIVELIENSGYYRNDINYYD